MVVVEHTRGPKSNDVVEIVGSHDPFSKNTEIKVDRVKYWIDNGAQPSDRVHNMLVSEKIIDGKKINVLSKKSPIVKEQAEEEKAEAPAEEGGDEAPAEEATKEKTEDAPAEDTPAADEQSEEVPSEVEETENEKETKEA